MRALPGQRAPEDRNALAAQREALAHDCLGAEPGNTRDAITAAPKIAAIIARDDLAEVAIVSAVEPRARNRAFIVTQASEPRARSDWRDQLEGMPGD